jgi:hypothetical protein
VFGRERFIDGTVKIIPGFAVNGGETMGDPARTPCLLQQQGHYNGLRNRSQVHGRSAFPINGAKVNIILAPIPGMTRRRNERQNSSVFTMKPDGDK